MNDAMLYDLSQMPNFDQNTVGRQSQPGRRGCIFLLEIVPMEKLVVHLVSSKPHFWAIFTFIFLFSVCSPVTEERLDILLKVSCRVPPNPLWKIFIIPLYFLKKRGSSFFVLLINTIVLHCFVDQYNTDIHFTKNCLLGR